MNKLGRIHQDTWGYIRHMRIPLGQPQVSFRYQLILCDLDGDVQQPLVAASKIGHATCKSVVGWATHSFDWIVLPGVELFVKQCFRVLRRCSWWFWVNDFIRCLPLNKVNHVSTSVCYSLTIYSINWSNPQWWSWWEWIIFCNFVHAKSISILMSISVPVAIFMRILTIDMTRSLPSKNCDNVWYTLIYYMIYYIWYIMI